VKETGLLLVVFLVACGDASDAERVDARLSPTGREVEAIINGDPLSGAAYEGLVVVHTVKGDGTGILLSRGF
jgi:hypothetical protein